MSKAYSYGETNDWHHPGIKLCFAFFSKPGSRRQSQFFIVSRKT
jgi:hypothetical protein